MKFVAALGYHFCLALPATFTQPGDHLLGEPCNSMLCLPCLSERKGATIPQNFVLSVMEEMATQSKILVNLNQMSQVHSRIPSDCTDLRSQFKVLVTLKEFL